MTEEVVLDEILRELFVACGPNDRGLVSVDDCWPMLRGLSGEDDSATAALAPADDGVDAAASAEVLEGLFGAGVRAVDFERFRAGVAMVVEHRIASLFEACDADDDGLLNAAELAATGVDAASIAGSDALSSADGVDAAAFRALFLRSLRPVAPAETSSAAVTVEPPPPVASSPQQMPPPLRSPSARNVVVEGYVLESAAKKAERELRACGLSDGEIDAARAAFAAADGDGDGVLSIADVQRFLGPTATTADAQTVLAFCDRSWSGDASFAEFARAAHDLRASSGFDLLGFVQLSSAGPAKSQQQRELMRAIGTPMVPPASPTPAAIAAVVATATTPRRASAEDVSAARIEELREELDTQQMARKIAEDSVETLRAQLSAVQDERDRLRGQLAAASAEQRAAAEACRDSRRSAQELELQAEELRMQVRDLADVNQSLRRQLKDANDLVAALEARSTEAEQQKQLQQPLSASVKERAEQSIASRERYESAIIRLEEQVGQLTALGAQQQKEAAEKQRATELELARQIASVEKITREHAELRERYKGAADAQEILLIVNLLLTGGVLPRVETAAFSAPVVENTRNLLRERAQLLQANDAMSHELLQGKQASAAPGQQTTRRTLFSFSQKKK